MGQASVVLGTGYVAGALLSVALNGRPPGSATSLSAPTIDGWMLLAFLSIQLTSTADTVLLGLLSSPAEAGVYSAAYRLEMAHFFECLQSGSPFRTTIADGVAAQQLADAAADSCKSGQPISF